MYIGSMYGKDHLNCLQQQNIRKTSIFLKRGMGKNIYKICRHQNTFQLLKKNEAVFTYKYGKIFKKFYDKQVA